MRTAPLAGVSAADDEVMKNPRTFVVLLLALFSTGPAPAAEDLIERGRYVFHAAGCASCHTGDQLMAGGRPVDTAFGTFYPPNITPHAEHGIGSWSEQDFARALRQGISPRGKHYYPAFPYTAYTKMSGRDIRALYAYLKTLPVSAREIQPHELHWPYSIRPLLSLWKSARFTPGEYRADPARSGQWNRGAYLADALGHCSECHTPRNFMGALRHDRYLAGSCAGPDGRRVPNITPDRQTGIGHWSSGELGTFLATGRKPDGTYTGSLMAEVLGTTCMRLNPYDLQSLVVYLQSVPVVRNNLDERCVPFDDSFVYE